MTTTPHSAYPGDLKRSHHMFVCLMRPQRVLLVLLVGGLEFTHQWRFGLLVKRLNEPFVPTHTPMRGTAPSMNLCQLSVSYSGGWLDLKGAAAAFRLLCVWSMGLPRGGPHGSFMFQSGFRGGGPCRFQILPAQCFAEIAGGHKVIFGNKPCKMEFTGRR